MGNASKLAETEHVERAKRVIESDRDATELRPLPPIPRQLEVNRSVSVTGCRCAKAVEEHWKN
jgi:hypothetical protein